MKPLFKLLLLLCALCATARAQVAIRISGDMAAPVANGGIIDSNAFPAGTSAYFVRGDFVQFEFSPFAFGSFASNVTMFTNITLGLWPSQNATNIPYMLESITNSSNGWNSLCTSNNWIYGPTGSTNQNVVFTFSNSQTSFTLNGQNAQSYWLRIYGVTTNAAARDITMLEGPITVYDGPITASYIAPNYPSGVTVDPLGNLLSPSDFWTQNATAIAAAISAEAGGVASFGGASGLITIDATQMAMSGNQLELSPMGTAITNAYTALVNLAGAAATNLVNLAGAAATNLDNARGTIYSNLFQTIAADALQGIAITNYVESAISAAVSTANTALGAQGTAITNWATATFTGGGGGGSDNFQPLTFATNAASQIDLVPGTPLAYLRSNNAVNLTNLPASSLSGSFSAAITSTNWPHWIWVSQAGNDASANGTNILSPLATLTNALALANTLGGSNLIMLGPGVFPIPGTNIIPANTALIGAAQNLTTILQPAPVNNSLGLVTYNDNVTLRDLTIGSNSASGATYNPFVPWGGTNFLAQNVTFNGDIDCIGDFAGTSITTNLWVARFSDCTFASSLDGVLVQTKSGAAGTNSVLRFFACVFSNTIDSSFGASDVMAIDAAGACKIETHDCLFNGTNNASSGYYCAGIELNSANAACLVSGNTYTESNGATPANSYGIVANAGVLNIIGLLNPAQIASVGGAVNYLDSAAPYLQSAFTWTNKLSMLGAVYGGGFMLTNTTAAASGAQQNSPGLLLVGQGWSSGAVASEPVGWDIVAGATQGTTPSSTLYFGSTINGGAYTSPLTVASGGNVTCAGSYFANAGFQGGSTTGNAFNFSKSGAPGLYLVDASDLNIYGASGPVSLGVSGQVRSTNGFVTSSGGFTNTSGVGGNFTVLDNQAQYDGLEIAASGAMNFIGESYGYYFGVTTPGDDTAPIFAGSYAGPGGVILTNAYTTLVNLAGQAATNLASGIGAAVTNDLTAAVNASTIALAAQGVAITNAYTTLVNLAGQAVTNLANGIGAALTNDLTSNYQPLKATLTSLGALANASGYLENDGSGDLSWGAGGGGSDNFQPLIFATNAASQIDLLPGTPLAYLSSNNAANLTNLEDTNINVVCSTNGWSTNQFHSTSGGATATYSNIWLNIATNHTYRVSITTNNAAYCITNVQGLVSNQDNWVDVYVQNTNATRSFTLWWAQGVTAPPTGFLNILNGFTNGVVITNSLGWFHFHGDIFGTNYMTNATWEMSNPSL